MKSLGRRQETSFDDEQLLKSLGGFHDDDDTSGSYWPSSLAIGDEVRR
jgi:hypothetical protein